jgi:hypothetical protein
MEIYSGDLKLKGESQFVSDWNYISDLFQKWRENETDENWNRYFDAKLALEP